MSRNSVAHIIALGEEMPMRERQIVETVARLSLMSGRQLRQLFFDQPDHDYSSAPSPTRERVARRVLAELVEQRVLARLEHRRRGGEGGGSASWVYALGPAGPRLIAYWAGEGLPRSRSTYEPSIAWTAHTLAVSDLYVRLKLAERAGQVELLSFDAEPACWRRYTRLAGMAGCLKPDAFVRLGIDEYEDAFFIEIDMGSERRGQLTRQHHVYVEHFRSGAEQTLHGIYPAVLWLVPDEKRAELLSDIQRRLPEPNRRPFMVATFDQALDVLSGQTDVMMATGAAS
jgi:hypothetical protein